MFGVKSSSPAICPVLVNVLHALACVGGLIVSAKSYFLPKESNWLLVKLKGLVIFLSIHPLAGCSLLL